MLTRLISTRIIVFTVIISILIIAGCGEDEILYSPVKETLQITTLDSSQTELFPGETMTINSTIEYSGKESLLSYTWQVTGGSIANNGKSAVYIAPDESGEYTITLMVTDDIVDDQKSITVFVKAAPHTLIIDSNTHWPATTLKNVLQYDIQVDSVFDNWVELKYDIIQDQAQADAFLSISINDVVVNDVDEKPIGGFIPSTDKRTIEKSDVSNLIRAPGQYTVTFTLKLASRVERGWLLNEAKLFGVEGISKRRIL